MLTDEVKKKLDSKFGFFAILGGEKFYNGKFEPAVSTREVADFITEMVEVEKKESYKEGALWAYKMFLETIKDAKSKFPNSKEFEIVVDVRDIEKSIEYLSKGSKVKE